jgi:hypothetical protein
MPGLQTIADVRARHIRRSATPSPAQPPATAPSAAPRIHQVDRGEGYDLVVAGERTARLERHKDGWSVANLGAGHQRVLADRRQADALAWRIARMVAA